MKKRSLRLILSNKKGRISIAQEFEATGMEAGSFFRLKPEELIRLPAGSRLFMLPKRSPVGYDGRKNRYVTLEDNFAVAAFLPPGYTGTFTSSYIEQVGLKPLPLYAYTAVSMYRSELYAAAIHIDRDRRHDSRFIDISLVRKNVHKLKRLFPDNRLIRHLEACALAYGCCGAQNFFLQRYEGPLPSSPFCNARCIGCISYQALKRCPESQPRIKFVPTPKEVSDIALFHIANVKNTVVSFGQGCDGEPLLAGDCIEKSVRLIRRETSRGVININTNASRPDVIKRLFDAGIDSIRVSLNSARPEYYRRYYKPVGYDFGDVMRSIDMAKRCDGFVSINYLTMPGFTDSADEFRAFNKLIGDRKIDMIQWRNLNFDPILYFRELKLRLPGQGQMGIRTVIESLRRRYPRLLMGYFNPREAVFRHR